MRVSFADIWDTLPKMQPAGFDSGQRAAGGRFNRKQNIPNASADGNSALPVPETVSDQVELLSLLYLEL